MLPLSFTHCLKANSLVNHRSLSTSKDFYDIIIAGGGMVGTTLACTLGKNKKLSHKKILLLENAPETKQQLSDKYSNRVSSLNLATFKLLNKIDAWRHISQARFGSIKRMQVWDALSDAAITFDPEQFEEIIAYVVENDVLLDAVKNELKDVHNVDVVYKAKINNCCPQEGANKVTVHMEDSRGYSCDLLMGCDGATSMVRKTMGIHHISHNYNQMGVVATLKLQEDSENVVAWQRHLPNGGFLALLPLKNGLSSLVWSTNPKEAKNLLKMNDEEFIGAINSALCSTYSKNSVVDQATKTFDNLIRYFNLPSSSLTQIPPKVAGCEENSRAAFPLSLGHATNYVGKGVVLVGDAAHRLHPLAGQGVNLGFGDVICLNKVLGDIVYSGGKLDDVSSLREYETERQRHNVPIMLTVHGLFQLYNTQFTPLVLLRSLGLQATNALTPLKKLIMAQASN